MLHYRIFIYSIYGKNMSYFMSFLWVNSLTIYFIPNVTDKPIYALFKMSIVIAILK